MFFLKKKVIRIEPTLNLEPAPRKIAFIDGDQDVIHNLGAYHKHIKGNGYETHFITITTTPNKVKALAKEPKFNVINLGGMNLASGKEVTDKYIAAYIQKAVADGYNDIIVVSNDYDFVDIFKMSAQLCDMSKIHFKLIAPKATGKLVNCKVAGLEIIRMQKGEAFNAQADVPTKQDETDSETKE